MKNLLFILLFFGLKAASQTAFPLYVPTNPDSIKQVVTVNGSPRQVYNIDLTKFQAAKAAHDTATALRLLIPTNNNQLTNGAGFITSSALTPYLTSSNAASTYLTNILGLVTAGTNVTVTGGGTSGSPYVINSTGGGGGSTDTTSLSRRINRKLKLYNVDDYGAAHDGVTDDQAAIQSAINACHAAGGGVVYFPNGIYILASAVDAASGAQIYVPLSTYNRTDTLRVIKLLGETSPSQYTTPTVDATSNQKMPVTGVIFQSTLQGSTGAIIGSRSQTVSWGNFSFSELQMENITVRAATRSGTTNTAATQTAIDGSKLAFINLKNLRVDVQPASDSILQPATTSVGIYMPKVNNFAFTTINNVLVTGYYKGAIISEHNDVDNLMMDGCYIGLSLEGVNYHGNQFNRVGIWRTKYNIQVASGSSGQININELALEDFVAAQYWFNFTSDLDESPNTWQGNIKFARGQANNAPTAITNGGFVRTGTSTSSLIRTVDITGLRYTQLPAQSVDFNFNEGTGNSGGGIGRAGSLYAGFGSISAGDVYTYNNGNVDLWSNGNKIRFLGGGTPTELGNIDALTGNVTFAQAYAGQKAITVTNTNAGASSQAIFWASNGASFANYGITGTGYTTYGALIANSPYLYTGAANGLTFMSDNASAPIKFASGGNAEKGRFSGAGNLLVNTTTDNSKLTVNGSISLAYVAKTAAYTATISDYTIDCNGTFTVTLPTAVGITGRIYVIKNSGTGTITLAGTSAQTFDGATSPTISTQFGLLRIQSNGANWIVL